MKQREIENLCVPINIVHRKNVNTAVKILYAINKITKTHKHDVQPYKNTTHHNITLKMPDNAGPI